GPLRSRRQVQPAPPDRGGARRARPLPGLGRVPPRRALTMPALRRTKIVATIGPASATHAKVRALAEAGMDAARLNLSHGSHEDHAASAALVRRVQAELGRPLALIADLQGPKLRIGDLPSPRNLLDGDEVVIVGAQTATNGELPIMPASIG